ncbi:MAG: YggS family pyridoxal phosphate-dependent enzyme, partial [Candidatus Eisenbacteria bacterium]|nr:YggS family pyridoxal phosphate-dependent enzyme [Candidatus Eisenbacteria bacterium]
MEPESAQIRERLEKLQERLAAAAARAGRTAEEITLVGVTKRFPPAVIRAAYAAGVRHIGENRAQELAAKQPELEDLPITWHMVGHLQSNKINKVLGRIQLLQSLDRASLAEALQKRLTAPLDCLVEVNTAGEASKSGVEPAGLPRLLDRIAACDRLRVRGLMTVGPLTDDTGRIRAAF